jgi:hypothetical protein
MVLCTTHFLLIGTELACPLKRRYIGARIISCGSRKSACMGASPPTAVSTSSSTRSHVPADRSGGAKQCTGGGWRARQQQLIAAWSAGGRHIIHPRTELPIRRPARDIFVSSLLFESPRMEVAPQCQVQFIVNPKITTTHETSLGHGPSSCRTVTREAGRSRLRPCSVTQLRTRRHPGPGPHALRSPLGHG